MLVKVELKHDVMTDSINGLIGLQSWVEQTLRDALNVSEKVELCPPYSLPRFEGKAKRVLDHRVS